MKPGKRAHLLTKKAKVELAEKAGLAVHFEKVLKPIVLSARHTWHNACTYLDARQAYVRPSYLEYGAIRLEKYVIAQGASSDDYPSELILNFSRVSNTHYMVDCIVSGKHMEMAGAAKAELEQPQQGSVGHLIGFIPAGQGKKDAAVHIRSHERIGSVRICEITPLTS